MRVYRASSDAGWSFIIAAPDVDTAYRIAADSDKGYVDIDGVSEINYKLFTTAEVPEVIDEF